MNKSTLVVGIGSYHGWDQLGWLVTDHLAQSSRMDADFRLAVVPIDLLDWISGYTSLHVIDAWAIGLPSSQASEPNPSDFRPTIARWEWPFPDTQAHSISCHGIDVRSALELSSQLDVLPPHVVAWGIGVPYHALLSSPKPFDVIELARRAAQQLESLWNEAIPMGKD